MSLNNTKIDCVVHVSQIETLVFCEMKDPVLLYGSGGERAQIVERSRIESVHVTGTPKNSTVSVHLRKQEDNDKQCSIATTSHKADCQRVDLTPAIPVGKANEYCRLLLQCLKTKDPELCQYISQE